MVLGFQEKMRNAYKPDEKPAEEVHPLTSNGKLDTHWTKAQLEASLEEGRARRAEERRAREAAEQNGHK